MEIYERLDELEADKALVRAGKILFVSSELAKFSLVSASPNRCNTRQSKISLVCSTMLLVYNVLLYTL